MFSRLLTWLVNKLQRFAVAVNCPACDHRFVPLSDRPLQHWREIMGRFPCPHCGHRFGIGEDKLAMQDNPPGPFAKPDGSRIEHWGTDEGALLFYLPPSGHWGGLLVFALIWNALILPLFYFAVLQGAMWQIRGPKMMISLFAAVGVGLLYASVRQRFSSHLLYLGPEEIRLRRSFILRRTFTLPVAAIESVWREEAYSSTGGSEDAPVQHKTCAIEIRAGLRRIRFGSALTPSEQHWLAWEIRQHARAHGAAGLGEELPQDPVGINAEGQP